MEGTDAVSNAVLDVRGLPLSRVARRMEERWKAPTP